MGPVISTNPLLRLQRLTTSLGSFKSSTVLISVGITLKAPPIETAETGHLVFGTLHTNTAPSTVDRVIDQFPADQQAQIRTMLSESLKGVISQTLVKGKKGGRVAALEFLIVTSAVSNLIREGKTYQIPSIMQTSKSMGMRTLNDAFLELVLTDKVTPEEAYNKSVERAELEALFQRNGITIPT